MEKQNVLVIGTSQGYNWDQLKYWVNSLNKTGFSGRKVLICINTDDATKQKLKDEGVEVVERPMNPNIPIHVMRFLYMADFLKKIPFDDSGKEELKILTTDVRDVIFQTNPEYDANILGIDSYENPYLVAPEMIQYKNESWGKDNITSAFGTYVYDELKDKMIYNVGCIATLHDYAIDLFHNIFFMGINRAIPITDQAVYNFLMHQHPYKYQCNSDGDWAVQLGTTMDPSKIAGFRPNLVWECGVDNNIPLKDEDLPYFDTEGVVQTKHSIFSIVHQYDRVPELRKIIEAKYG